MPDTNSDFPSFIQIEDQLINLRFVKSLRLSGTTLEVTVPHGDGETTYMLHGVGAQVFDRIKSHSLNHA